MSVPAQVSGSGRPPPWRDVRVLRIVFQLLVVGAVVGLLLWLNSNLTTNLNRQGIRTDFGYLERPAGFAIADSDFDSASPVWRALLVGVKNTAIVSLAGIVLATLVGLIVGVSRLSPNWLVARMASFYVEAIRNVPVLLIIIFMYVAVMLRLPPIDDATEWLGSIVISNSGVAVPSARSVGDGSGLFGILLVVAAVAALLVARWRTRRSEQTGEPHHRVAWSAAVFVGTVVMSFLATGAPLRVSTPAPEGFRVAGGISMSPEFAALLAGLVLYTASHIAEIVRGSILAVSKGQSEAARALGLGEFQRYRHVVLPQALRIMIPPLANQYLNLTKNSSLAVFIAYPEVTRVTQIVTGQGNPAPQSILLLMGVYLVFSLSISLFTNAFNRRMALATR